MHTVSAAMKSPHTVNPLEMVEAAVGVVDAAWTAIDRHRDHAHHDAAAAAWEDCVNLERELIQEKHENHRLKAALEELRKALYEVKVRDGGQQLGCVNRSLTFEEGCPADFHERLQKRVNTPAFLDCLKELHSAGSQEQLPVDTKDDGKNLEKEDCGSWVMLPEVLLEADEREESCGLDGDEFLLISQEDVIESLAAFVAKLVLSNPHAKAMSPLQIQEAISASFARLEQKGMLRKLWNATKFIYSSVTWTTTLATTALGLYKNPFIVRALLKAMTMSSHLVIMALT